jgi:hypothetical protein
VVLGHLAPRVVCREGRLARSAKAETATRPPVAGHDTAPRRGSAGAAMQILEGARKDAGWVSCVVPTCGMLKPRGLPPDQIAKASSPNATATRGLSGSSTASS